VDPLNAPVVLWLQGGPGSSSLFGQFEVNGPYLAVYNWYGKTHATLNPHAWSKKVNIIYIDNPIAVGEFNLTF
jgi:vitellogenic carboxypeptidase-like protein